MGSTRPAFRRVLGGVVTAALIAAAAIATGPAATAADAPSLVSPTALPTAQVNGVVWTQIVVGTTVYVGGSFDTAQPAGARAGEQTVPRHDMLAYDVTTGALLPFAPDFNAQVLGLAASPDGTTVYAVGSFTSVDGVARSRIVALDARTGAVRADFAPKANNTVVAVAATSSTVFLGGSFTSLNGTSRSRAAAVSSSTARLTAWAPRVADHAVRALVVSPDRSKVVLGGSFTSVAGKSKPGRGLAAVTSTTGAPLPWEAGKLIYNGGTNAAVYSLSATGTTVYATGYVFGKLSDGNLEGTIAMRWKDGATTWVEDCHGDSYSSVPYDGAVYVATHAHFCGNIGGWPQTDPQTVHRAIGFTQAATRTVAHNTVRPDRYFDFGGRPGPSLVDFYPEFDTGTYTGEGQAAWSVAAGAGYVVFGGEFRHVGGKRQTGLVRFKGVVDGSVPPPVSDPAPAPTPPVPARVARPDAVALGPSRIAVKWSAPKSAGADGVTGYSVQVYKAERLVKTVRVAASKRLAVLTGLQRSTTYRVGVSARNATGAGEQSVLDPAKTRSKGANVSATKRPGAVGKPSATAGRTSVRVRWKGASSTGALPVSAYQVRVVHDGRTVQRSTVDGAARSDLVRKLLRRTAYAVSVRARNWAGWGRWSTAAAVRTR